MERIGVWTRYYGPTNHRGSRIRVTWGGSSVTVPYDHGAYNANESAVREALTGWGREVVSLESVAPTESRRGTVYLVTLADRMVTA
jgi:hypothetical protein